MIGKLKNIAAAFLLLLFATNSIGIHLLHDCHEEVEFYSQPTADSHLQAQCGICDDMAISADLPFIHDYAFFAYSTNINYHFYIPQKVAVQLNNPHNKAPPVSSLAGQKIS